MRFRWMLVLLVGIVFALAPATGFTKYKYIYSGFLSDYSKIKPNPGGSYTDESGIAFLYKKEGSDLKKYNKILLDRVVFFFKPDAKYKGINPDEMKALADTFHQAFRETIGKEYPIVQEPGPDVLRIRTALTEVVPTQPTLNTITSIPGVHLLSTAKRVTTGVHAYVAEATLEAEFLDSKSNEQLVALLDRRGSPKEKISKGMTKWGQIQIVFEEWGRLMQQMLDEAHGKPVKGIYEPINK